ncbi:ABC transporter substrate-binding protein [Paenibacillus sp. LjRoot56]|uniref:ABC transporter substrate-binding protein n=1 Tax=Paenibacillus sp. LjRoot56 TaxID=3342333 RepID=UPI003ED0B42F
MKKLLLTGLVLSMMGLAACSQSNTDNVGKQIEGTVTTAAKNEVIKLKMWGAIPPENGPQQMVDNWNKANPNIQVEYLRYVNDDAGNTKLDTALLAGGQVDVFINYGMAPMQKRIKAKIAEPLDSYFAKDKFNIEENFGDKSILKINNSSYYIPAIILNEFVSLNKSYLDEAGLPIPKTWTLDEYADYATKLTKGDGASKRYGSFIGCLEPKTAWMNSIVKTELGPDAYYKKDGTSNFDAPPFKKYIDVMVNLERNLKAQPAYAEANTTKLQGTSMFATGKAAMNLCGTASIRTIKDIKNFPHDFVTALAPTPNISSGGKYPGGGTSYFDYVSINADSKYKDASWKFLKWYVTEGNEPLIASGRVPSWKKVDRNKVLKLLLGDNPEKLFDLESFKRVIFSENDYVVDSNVEKLPELTKVVNEEVEKALLGEQTSAATIANMKKNGDKILLGK